MDVSFLEKCPDRKLPVFYLIFLPCTFTRKHNFINIDPNIHHLYCICIIYFMLNNFGSDFSTKASCSTVQSMGSIHSFVFGKKVYFFHQGCISEKYKSVKTVL